jgi:hypothetical protein
MAQDCDAGRAKIDSLVETWKVSILPFGAELRGEREWALT